MGRVDKIETGLINFGRRHYIPSLGRWLTPDPLGFHDGMNLYAYVHNNPLNHFDEYGLLDFGQYDKDWHAHVKLHHKAVAHELVSQACDIGRFFTSMPFSPGAGIQSLMRGEATRTDGWQRCQDRFFDSATDWVQRTFPADMTHPTYMTTRNITSWVSFAAGANGLARGAVRYSTNLEYFMSNQS